MGKGAVAPVHRNEGLILRRSASLMQPLALVRIVGCGASTDDELHVRFGQRNKSGRELNRGLLRNAHRLGRTQNQKAA
jgi:hypothetical protein